MHVDARARRLRSVGRGAIALGMLGSFACGGATSESGQPLGQDASLDSAASAPVDATVPADGETADATVTDTSDADAGRGPDDAKGAGLPDADASADGTVVPPSPRACNAPEPAAPLAVGATDAAPPAWLGGTIPVGTYVATSITAYSALAVQEGLQPCVPDLLKGFVWSFEAGADPSSGTLTSVATLVGNGDVILMPISSGPYATSGTMLAFSPTCGACFSGSTIQDAARCAACQGSDAAACSNCFSECSVGPVGSDTADGGGAPEVPYTVTSTGLVVGESLAAGCGMEVIEFARRLSDGGLAQAATDGSADAGGDGAPGSACSAACDGGPSCVVSPPCDFGCGSGEWCEVGFDLCYPGLFVFPVSAITASVGVPFTAYLGSIADLDTQDPPNALVVTIDWGDGTSSRGYVTGANGNFGVTGTHTYSATGTVTLSWSASSPCTAVTASGTIPVTVD